MALNSMKSMNLSPYIVRNVPTIGITPLAGAGPVASPETEAWSRVGGLGVFGLDALTLEGFWLSRFDLWLRIKDLWWGGSYFHTTAISEPFPAAFEL